MPAAHILGPVLDGLPSPADRRLAVRATRDALRHVRRGHPWLFDASITSVSHEGAPGDLAVIFDDKREFAAIGLWDPASPMRVRILHHGRPTPIDDEFWYRRLDAALAVRQPLLDDAQVTGQRLVHGENDGVPGLVIDQYAAVAVVKIYSAAWFAHLAPLLDALDQRVGPESVVLRLARAVAPTAPDGVHDGVLATGTHLAGPVPFLERGAAMTADPIDGQKTGYFLDQRANRRLIRGRSDGARVLDVFCCHGGFSVHAALGGARHVHSVDLSPHATESAKRHVGLNAPTDHRVSTGDAFEVMAGLAEQGEQYDVVVVDPPSFASRRDAVPGALRAYTRLTHLALDLVAPGGTLLQASCSSRIDAEQFETTVRAAAERADRPLRGLEVTGHDIDHPIGFPEGAYLKAVVATVGA